MVRMSDELLKICEDFTYTPPAPLGDRDWYIQTRRDREGEGRQVNNIAITIPVREAIYANKNIGRGNFSKWCKKNVFDYYNMYPKVDGQSIVDIITSKYRKLKR